MTWYNLNSIISAITYSSVFIYDMVESTEKIIIVEKTWSGENDFFRSCGNNTQLSIGNKT